MKNIFKKNQIIITALAIMIIIAGFLAFTREKPEDGDGVQTINPDTEDGLTASDEDGTDVAQNEIEEPGAADDIADDLDAEVTDENGAATAADDDANTTADEADDMVPVNTEDEDSDELGDISDEDILQTAQDVTDTGEIGSQEGTPGEAVLVSTVLDAGYFSSAKLEREQDRARAKEDLYAIMESATLTEAAKKDAVDKMLELADIMDRENAAEVVLGAKGFDNAMVYIVDGRVDVVIDTPSINDQQVAIIEQVVMDKTGADIGDISIHPVVVEE